jgi:hypothetical protein
MPGLSCHSLNDGRWCGEGELEAPFYPIRSKHFLKVLSCDLAVSQNLCQETSPHGLPPIWTATTVHRPSGWRRK